MRAILGELGVERTPPGAHDRGLEQDRPPRRRRREAMAQVAARAPQVVPMSARTGQGLPALLAAVEAALAEPTRDETLRLASTRVASAPGSSIASSCARRPAPTDGYELAVRWTDRDRASIARSGRSSSDRAALAPGIAASGSPAVGRARSSPASGRAARSAGAWRSAGWRQRPPPSRRRAGAGRRVRRGAPARRAPWPPAGRGPSPAAANARHSSSAPSSSIRCRLSSMRLLSR